MAAAAAASTVAVCARGPLRGYSIAFNFNLMPKEDRPAIVYTILYHGTVAKIQKEISFHGACYSRDWLPQRLKSTIILEKNS